MGKTKYICVVVGLMAALVACDGGTDEPAPTPSVAASGSSSGSSPTNDPPSTPSTPLTAVVNPTGSGETKSVAIDNAAGGTVALADGTTIDVPAGALPAGVSSITVTSQTTPAPAEYKTFAPLFKFGPDGAVFEKPLKVSFPVTLPSNVALSDATILWSRPAGQPGFDMVPTTFTPVAGSERGYIATAEVTHFSEGTCGLKYTTDPHPAPDPYRD